MIKLVL